jgi:streptogramin lyase
VTTLAGTPGLVPGSSGAMEHRDGRGTEARFLHPRRIVIDESGNLHVADRNAIRRITPDGVVTTMPGTGPDIGTNGTAADVHSWGGIDIDSEGNLYAVGAHRIYQISRSGTITVLAGSATSTTQGSQDTTSGVTGFKRIDGGITSDAAGNLYVADTGDHTIRRITPGGVVSTLAGSSGQADTVDGVGSTARFRSPSGLTSDGAGNLYVFATASRIRKITPQGAVSSLEQFSPGGTLSVVVTADAAGNLYVPSSNNILKITPAGEQSAFPSQLSSDEGLRALAADTNGNVFAVTTSRILRFSSSGTSTSFVSLPPGYSPRAATIDRNNNLYVAYMNYGFVIETLIQKIGPGGEATTVYRTPDPYAGPRTILYAPTGLAMADADSLAITTAQGVFLLDLP